MWFFRCLLCMSFLLMCELLKYIAVNILINFFSYDRNCVRCISLIYNDFILIDLPKNRKLYLLLDSIWYGLIFRHCFLYNCDFADFDSINYARKFRLFEWRKQFEGKCNAFDQNVIDHWMWCICHAWKNTIIPFTLLKQN